MHTNHRRKQGKHNPNREGQGFNWAARAPKEDRRLFWKGHRAKEFRLLAHGRHDALDNRAHRHGILWNWW